VISRSNGLTIVTILVGALSLVACGSDRATTPTAPSSSAPVPASGTATISGTVTNTTAARTVAIVGTNTSSAIDGAGRFELRSVPSGDVQLQFNGIGLDARGTIAGVSAGQQIRIMVTIAGSVATLDDQERVAEDNRVELTGTISTGACGSFTLNGVTVTTSSATVFEHGACADIRPGRRVEVKGTRQGTGPVTATGIEFKDEPNNNNNEVELEGTISAGACGSFTLNGVTVTTSSATVFEHGACADLRPGRRVEVKGTRQGTGPVAATRIEFKDEPNDANTEVEIEGTISAGACGSFTLNGVTVTTNSTTRFEHGTCADVRPGRRVEVKGTRQGTGPVAASRVEFK
jgi:hypothetical protein